MTPDEIDEANAFYDDLDEAFWAEQRIRELASEQQLAENRMRFLELVSAEPTDGEF